MAFPNTRDDSPLNARLSSMCGEGPLVLATITHAVWDPNDDGLVRMREMKPVWPGVGEAQSIDKSQAEHWKQSAPP
jgi:hypothetical protein